MPEITTERDDSAKGKSASKLPIITFSTFIVSLNAAVLANLGIIDEPGAGKRIKNLLWPNRRLMFWRCSKKKPAEI